MGKEYILVIILIMFTNFVLYADISNRLKQIVNRINRIELEQITMILDLKQKQKQKGENDNEDFKK